MFDLGSGGWLSVISGSRLRWRFLSIATTTRHGGRPATQQPSLSLAQMRFASATMAEERSAGAIAPPIRHVVARAPLPPGASRKLALTTNMQMQGLQFRATLAAFRLPCYYWVAAIVLSVKIPVFSLYLANRHSSNWVASIGTHWFQHNLNLVLINV